ncbi:MAG: SLBB domain-containing protein [Pyrinomonadaceae bacterium]
MKFKHLIQVLMLLGLASASAAAQEPAPSPTPVPTPAVQATQTSTAIPTPDPAPTPSETIQSGMIILPGDTLEITVARRAEFDWRGPMDSGGSLQSLPYVDTAIRAVCRTEEAVARDLAAAYAKYIVNPVVTVRVVDHNGRAPAIVLGAVRTPQRFLMQRAVRINELIALSGGITDRASGDIQLYRSDLRVCRADGAGGESRLVADDGTPVHVIKIRELIGGDPNANPIVGAGDIVTVLESEPIYVTGGVRAPQSVGFHDEMTLSRALALAGGLSDDARGSEIKIYRRELAAGRSGLIEADLGAILSGKKPDVVLRPYDIITVPQSGRGAAPRPSSELLDAISRSDQTATLPLRIVN